MANVMMHAVVSVDGFIADAEDQVGPLFDWYVNGDIELFVVRAVTPGCTSGLSIPSICWRTRTR